MIDYISLIEQNDDGYDSEVIELFKLLKEMRNRLEFLENVLTDALAKHDESLIKAEMSDILSKYRQKSIDNGAEM